MLIVLSVLALINIVLFAAKTWAKQSCENYPTRTCRPNWLPAEFHRLGICETGLNWRFANSTYVSAFGIYRPAWAEFRPSWVPAVPERATPKQQLAVAKAIARRFGYSAWECWTNFAWVRYGR